MATGTAPLSSEDPDTLSAECALAERPGYGDLHKACRQTHDVPLPHAYGILLLPSCGCGCHTLPAGSKS
ncbi:hypothetical protein AQJ67_41900 [Streptomyces caeruleatus]|uniref:Uncharacterized protein n=1 Tax=Streptomyces caeruleatus TaxID=661399 RepID=A0A101TG08_9ACTN|nr:hypothetical protein AQJ67_41900 [Streptomyces caeruleatus]